MASTYLESRIQSFDDFRDTESMAIAGSISPYQYTDFKEKDKLEWLNQFFDYSLNAGEARFRTYRKNMYLYKGIHWKGESSNARSPKQSVNFIAEMTEAKIAARAAKKVNFTTIPVDDDQLSVNAAKGSKLLLDARCKQLDFDALNIDLDRIAIQQGHAFFHVNWNPHAGGVHPMFEKIEELGGKTLDKVKKKVGADKVFIGDVDVSVLGANQVMPEPKKKQLHVDVDYVDIVELVHIEELKAKYPTIEAEEAEIGDCAWTLDDEQDNTGYAVVHTFYHRKTPRLPNGVMIKWIRTAILEEKELPFRHGMIPLVDDKDIRVTGEFFGRSCYMNVYNLQRFYNLIQTGQARNFSIGNVPKWVYPKGSVNPNAINNEFVAMEYTGATPPQLVSNQNLGETGFNLQDRIESKISKQMGVYAMQRGDVPQGITANSALRFIDEQESKRDSTGIAGRNSRIIKALNMIMDTMAQYYKAGDGRTIRALGEDNEYLIKNLSKVDFTKVYKVDIQKTSALSDTKAGRISDIIDLNQVTQTDPVFKRDEIIEMLDLGVDRAFKRRSAVGINAARAMLDMILEGQDVPEPQMYDSLVVHYKVFTDALEEDRYKNRFPQDIQLKLADRVKTMEGLMYIKATQNIKFAQEVAALEKYPIFFTLPMPIHTIIMQASQPVQQTLPAANTSEFEINNTEEMTNGR